MSSKLILILNRQLGMILHIRKIAAWTDAAGPNDASGSGNSGTSGSSRTSGTASGGGG